MSTQIKDDLKICSHCKQEKSISEFYKNRNSKDGHTGQCKTCFSKYASFKWKNDPEYRKKSNEHWKVYSKQRRAKDPEYRKKIYKAHEKYIKKRIKVDPEFSRHQTELSYKHKICKLIKKHHVDLKDDPEHLTTEFIQKLIGVKCDVRDEERTS